MAADTRTYDVEEANRVLPDVRRLTAQISELSMQLPELQDQVRIAEYRMKRPGAEAVEADRFEKAAAALRGSEDDLTAALGGLGRLGVSLKDPRAGLVDFFSERDGELVELCWRLGEPLVAHWHRIGEGFAGRRPV
ncbi:MAG: DUF2203 domain-containing protein [Candidatus Dormibacteraeota bacterium]|nr:DUF2203 domain-containing protein [Candidatus Dormibacteraeota bacterium]